MKRNSQLSVALHVLLHLHELGGTITSSALGPMLQMNPVVVRRTFAGLREAGILHAVRGHGGGWSLGRPLTEVTLLEVYDALEIEAPFRLGVRDEAPQCLLERAANRAVGEALDDAEALLRRKLGKLTVAALLAGAQKGSRSHV